MMVKKMTSVLLTLFLSTAAYTVTAPEDLQRLVLETEYGMVPGLVMKETAIYFDPKEFTAEDIKRIAAYNLLDGKLLKDSLRYQSLNGLEEFSGLEDWDVECLFPHGRRKIRTYESVTKIKPFKHCKSGLSRHKVTVYYYWYQTECKKSGYYSESKTWMGCD